MLAPIAFSPHDPIDRHRERIAHQAAEHGGGPFASITLRVGYSSPAAWALSMFSGRRCSSPAPAARQTPDTRQRVRQALQETFYMDFGRVKAEKEDIEALIASGLCRPGSTLTPCQQSTTADRSGSRRRWFLPNQLMKISSSTMNDTVGASNACSIGVHRQQQQAQARQTREQHGTRDHLADGLPGKSRPPESSPRQAPHQTDLNGKIRVTGLLVDRHQDQKK